MEQKLNAVVTKVVTAPYNSSLVLLTILLWLIAFQFGYWNKNFDMLSTVENYIILLSAVSIITGMLSKGENAKRLVRLAVGTQFIAVFAVVSTKSVATGSFGVLVPVPISIFCFLLLLKYIWLTAVDKE